MRGYKKNIPPYLFNEDTDRLLFRLLVIVIIGLSMLVTTYSLYNGNPMSNWTPGEVDFSGSTALLLFIYIPVGFFVFQIVRMAFLYAAGRDKWVSDIDLPSNTAFDTFEINPVIDLSRSGVLLLGSLLGSGVINIIMQHVGKRSDAFSYGINVTILYFSVCVAIPVFIFMLSKIRQKRLRLLQTYRELGGEGN